MEHIAPRLAEVARNIEIVGADPATRFGFTQVPNFVLTNPELSVGAKLVYWACRGPAPVGLLASFKHARNVRAQLPEIVQLKKTEGLPLISEDDIFASGLHEDVIRQLGPYEREKHVYKGSDPGMSKAFPLATS